MRRGFTLLEVLLAAIILGSGLTAILVSMSQSQRLMLAAMNLVEDRQIGYGKLFCAIDVLTDLKLCAFREIADGEYRVEIFRHSGKTPLESSTVLRSLQRQCGG